MIMIEINFSFKKKPIIYNFYIILKRKKSPRKRLIYYSKQYPNIPYEISE